jgi:hypothetical protein
MFVLDKDAMKFMLDFLKITSLMTKSTILRVKSISWDILAKSLPTIQYLPKETIQYNPSSLDQGVHTWSELYFIA